MECDIGGRGVDKAVTSGKEVQEALVKFRPYAQAGPASKGTQGQSEPRTDANLSYPGKEYVGLLLSHGSETRTDQGSCCHVRAGPAP